MPANMLHQPGAVHRAVMKAVDDVLSMGLAHPEVNAAPVALRSAVRLLRRLEPLMLEELAKVPEAECLQMMRGLAASITELADGLDTKPRYRAQWETSGVTAQRRYRHWGHGQVIADSVAVSNPSDLERAFGMATTVIVQGAGGRKPRPELCAACVQVFHAGARSSRPQLLQVDEVRDHYHSNGAPFGGFDAIGMAVTGGRELGESVLICSQRTKGIPPSVMEELTKLYLFRLDFLRDAGRLQEMGAPITLRPPRVPFVFKYWTKADYEKVWGPYKLDL